MDNRFIKLRHIIIAVVFSLIALFACNHKSEQIAGVSSNEVAGEMVADTIIYSVVIKNSDPNDLWAEKSLSRLKRAQLVDQIFDAIYSHKAKAYSYNTDEQLSVSEIKDIEEREDFSRDKVAKMQFWETWYFDDATKKMTKKVHAVLVAYEVLSEEGELRGYKAAFYVKMENN